LSVTLATIRTEVSKRAEEYLAGVATGGSTTTVVDTNKLYAADGYWDEASILFTSGTNLNLERRVQSFSTATLTLYSAVTASVSAADTYELRRRFTIVDLDTAINRAINVGAPDFREKVRVDMTATADTYAYAVPIASNPSMSDKGLIGIEYGDTTVVPTRPLSRLPKELYDINEDYDATTTNATVKTLVLKFNPFTGYTIRFIFEGPLANVSVYTDRVHLDLPELEWLYSQSATELWRIELSRSTDASRKQALEELGRWEANADRLRRQLGFVRKQTPLRRTAFRITGV
jgi:hypothetical protein